MMSHVIEIQFPNGVPSSLGVGYELAEIIIGSIGIFVTGLLVYLIKRQVTFEKEILTAHHDKLKLSNDIESFKQFDLYYHKIIKVYADIITRLIDMNEGKKIKFIDDDIIDIYDLLSDLEIFAIKVKKLKMNKDLVENIIGNYIKEIMSNEQVKFEIKVSQKKDKHIFENIDELHKRLKN